MGNLIYILIVIAYFIWQAQQARNRNKAQEAAKGKGDEQPGRQVREVKPLTVEERMREIFREVEMKNKPFAQPDRTIVKKVDPKPQPQVAVPKLLKKEPSPFLTIDMTKEEIAPEGAWTPMGEERFSKTGFDYNKIATEHRSQKINLRDAVIGKIILERPDY